MKYMKYIYKNDGTVIEWTQVQAAICEMDNRGLPETQRHVLDFETSEPNNYKLDNGAVIEKSYDEKLSQGLIPLDELKKKKTAEVNLICETKILQGFWSNATGTNRHYQAESEDQMNLVGAVTANVDMSYKCGLEIGIIVYEFVNHTAEQLRQVLLDGASIKSAYLHNAYRLKSLIDACFDYEELFLINLNAGWL